MNSRDPRIDDYISLSADFAKPILQHIREVVHAACPEVVETMKWSMPHFEHHGVLCHMASFKAHCAMGFWKGSLLFDNAGPEKEAMGHMGRITAVSDLPPKKELVALVKKAAALNEEGVKVAKPARAPKQDLPTPPELVAALAKNAKARATFENFPPSHRREYVEWITEAKSDATRRRRLDQAVEWMAEGKGRNWKYARK